VELSRCLLFRHLNLAHSLVWHIRYTCTLPILNRSRLIKYPSPETMRIAYSPRSLHLLLRRSWNLYCYRCPSLLCRLYIDLNSIRIYFPPHGLHSPLLLLDPHLRHQAHPYPLQRRHLDLRRARQGVRGRHAGSSLSLRRWHLV